MANMFSGNTERAIPKNLSECTKTNATVANLHNWSEWLEKWGKIIFWVIVIIGAVVSVVEAVDTHEFRSEYRYELEELERLGTPVPTVAEVFISNILTWGFYAFLEYCAYHVLALLISALASITQNTMISANVALYNANAGKNSVLGNTSGYAPAPDGMWSCPMCGTHNKNEYGQCKKCGQFR